MFMKCVEIAGKLTRQQNWVGAPLSVGICKDKGKSWWANADTQLNFVFAHEMQTPTNEVLSAQSSVYLVLIAQPRWYFKFKKKIVFPLFFLQNDLA